MENKQQLGFDSSFTANLFGSEKSPPSTANFGSIFPPPSTGSNYTRSPFKGSTERPPYSFNQETPDNNQREGKYREEKKSIFQERVVSCPLSSSLYYGGQEDMYVKSSHEKSTEQYPNFKKDGGEDHDSDEKASRGNWWQGMFGDRFRFIHTSTEVQNWVTIFRDTVQKREFRQGILVV